METIKATLAQSLYDFTLKTMMKNNPNLIKKKNNSYVGIYGNSLSTQFFSKSKTATKESLLIKHTHTPKTKTELSAHVAVTIIYS